MILRDRKIFSGFRNGEVALFSASMAVMMYCYEVSCCTGVCKRIWTRH